MNRWMYRAQVKPGKLQQLQEALRSEGEGWKEALLRQGAGTCSIFAYEHAIFIYVEASFDSKDWSWPAEILQWLVPWPCGGEKDAYQALMPNVFYDGTLEEVQSCRQQRDKKERKGAFAVLKPEMVSSYVFYHYQKQEEHPGSFNLSYSIGLLGELLFSYCELPALKESSRIGKLATDHTPLNWHEVMAEHFAAGAVAGQSVWTEMELYFAL
ncbi:hypothetical protein B1748_27845 [Paenibacillus sp. MY03]|uniref:hypothetical protein n=1 Tax=Paenibacillus sp. MY03 TaxID=302980 RepID=UPI000B55FF43|nr:hypothetical protein [Paenibacillus sp. MY03]OUS70802.1 hypothetical protein B1748_27845 [Paenibacillus sp. MY03]